MNITLDCGAGCHMPQIDDDGDSVCLVCRQVLAVGAEGINGVSQLTGERIGFISALACMETDPLYDPETDTVHESTGMFRPRLGRGTSLRHGRGRHGERRTLQQATA